MQTDSDAMYLSKMYFCDCIWEGDKIIYPAQNYDVICETDIVTGETTVISSTDGEGELPRFAGAYRWKEYLLLPSWKAKTGIHLFSLKTKLWTYIPVDEKWKEYIQIQKFSIFECNGFLYMFSYLLVVFKVDIEKRSVEHILYPDMEIDSDWRGELVALGDVVYVSIVRKTQIYKFDLRTEQWEIVDVDTELRGIATLCYDGGLFWMTGLGQMVCSWDEKTNTSVSYREFPHRFGRIVVREGDAGNLFCRSVVQNCFIYFIPSDANMIVRFHRESGEMSELFIEDEWEDTWETRAGRVSTVKYGGIQRNKNVLMLMSNKNKNLIFIDLETEKIWKIEIKMSATDGMERLISATPMLQEGLVDLRSWAKYAGVGGETCIKENDGWQETIGGRIYSLC